MPEHGVGFVQFDLADPDFLHGHAGGFGNLGHVFHRMGQEFVQRRIEQPDGDRQPVHDVEQLDEVLALKGQQAIEGAAAVVFIFGQDHLAHVHDPLRLEEHVLGAAQPDPLGPEAKRRFRVGGGFGVGANAHGAHLVGPFHQGPKIAGQLRLDHHHRALHDLSGGAVDGNDVAFRKFDIQGDQLLGLGIDAQIGGPGNAGNPHAARDDGGVRRHAATGGQNSLADVHAADVLRRRFHPHQNHLFVAPGPGLGIGG